MPEGRSLSARSARATPVPQRLGGTVVLPLVLLLLVALAYSNAVSHPFLYDDLMLVVQNPGIRSLANIPEMIRTARAATM